MPRALLGGCTFSLDQQVQRLQAVSAFGRTPHPRISSCRSTAAIVRNLLQGDDPTWMRNAYGQIQPFTPISTIHQSIEKDLETLELGVLEIQARCQAM